MTTIECVTSANLEQWPPSFAIFKTWYICSRNC